MKLIGRIGLMCIFPCDQKDIVKRNLWRKVGRKRRGLKIVFMLNIKENMQRKGGLNKRPGGLHEPLRVENLHS